MYKKHLDDLKNAIKLCDLKLAKELIISYDQKLKDEILEMFYFEQISTTDYNGEYKIAFFLLKYGGNCDQIVKNKFLVDACIHNEYILAKYLLEQGADVHYDNDNSLCTASHMGHDKIVEILLEYGADIHIRNDYLLKKVTDQGHHKVVKILLKNGADIHKEIDFSLLLMHSASIKGNYKIVEIFKKHIYNKIEKQLSKKYTNDKESFNINHIKKQIQECVELEFRKNKLDQELNNLLKKNLLNKIYFIIIFFIIIIFVTHKIIKPLY